MKFLPTKNWLISCAIFLSVLLLNAIITVVRYIEPDVLGFFYSVLIIFPFAIWLVVCLKYLEEKRKER